jgi:hypothetical protein
VQLPKILDHSPELAAVIVGGNDLLRSNFSPETFEKNLRQTMVDLVSNGSTIMLLELHDPTVIVPMPYLVGRICRSPFGACIEKFLWHCRAWVWMLAAMLSLSSVGIPFYVAYGHDTQMGLLGPMTDLHGPNATGIQLGISSDILAVDISSWRRVDGIVSDPLCPPLSDSGLQHGWDDSRAAVFQKVTNIVVDPGRKGAYLFIVRWWRACWISEHGMHSIRVLHDLTQCGWSSLVSEHPCGKCMCGG